MDHFAKPADELSKALAEGRLHRNFMGYTVKKGQANANGSYDTDLYGFGVSAIGSLDRYYAQNEKKLSSYYEAIEAGHYPVHRGYTLSDEDLLRRQVILSVLCEGRLDFPAIEAAFGIAFRPHFAKALEQLEEPTVDGFLEWSESGFVLTDLGRIFSRNIAMVFDAHLQSRSEPDQKPLFSKTL
jgi:oxygen-independent coproporphyrinogen-3 oxidase